MNQFSDRPFALGSMFGIRSFRVTDAGELTGVVHTRPWYTGINEAKCSGPGGNLPGMVAALNAASANMAQFGWAMQSLSAQVNGKVLLKKRPRNAPRSTPPASPPAHDAGTLACTCGFYAYFDRGHNPHHSTGNILGIVEGFGVMTVGSRGFRCSKARIRALIVEDFGQGFALAKVMPNYPGVPAFPSIDAALAEFPLTVPDGTPEPSLDDLWASATRYVKFTLTADTSGLSHALAKISRDAARVTGDETPQERALRLRRERNNGPASRIGLNGHFRRRP